MNRLEKWVRENYSEEMSDIVNYGCSAGVHGLIYYDETSEIYNRFSEEIWEIACEMSEDMGQTPLQFIASLNGAKEVSDDAQFKNLLVWFAVEETARMILESAEVSE